MILRYQKNDHPLMRLTGDVQDLFGDLVSTLTTDDSFGFRPLRAWPVMNIWEDEHALFVEAEAPGFGMDNITVKVLGRELTIEGEQSESTEERDVVFHRKERTVSSFRRTVRLPFDVEAEKVTAKLRDGVLTITLPKVEAAQPRKIKVKNG